MFKPRLSPLSPMVSLAGAALVGGLAFASTAASAAGGAYYRAELASPAPKARFVARDVVWVCDGASCVAGRGTSRPAIMCSTLAKQAGSVNAFTANGKAFDADELARCNGAK